MGDERCRRRQAAIFIAAVLLLNAPVLAIADRATLPAGVPVTPFVLFAGWLAVIVMGAVNTRRPRA